MLLLPDAGVGEHGLAAAHRLLALKAGESGFTKETGRCRPRPGQAWLPVVVSTSITCCITESAALGWYWAVAVKASGRKLPLPLVVHASRTGEAAGQVHQVAHAAGALVGPALAVGGVCNSRPSCPHRPDNPCCRWWPAGTAADRSPGPPGWGVPRRSAWWHRAGKVPLPLLLHGRRHPVMAPFNWMGNHRRRAWSVPASAMRVGPMSSGWSRWRSHSHRCRRRSPPGTPTAHAVGRTGAVHRIGDGVRAEAAGARGEPLDAVMVLGVGRELHGSMPSQSSTSCPAFTVGGRW